ncbi:Uncharacterised protein [uncultured archaeon]|nr:Uncharacterised protein [uncultured archaeon]
MVKKNFLEDLKKEIMNLVTVYLLFITAIYYFFVKYKPEDAPTIFITYSVGIAILLILYWAIDNSFVRLRISQDFVHQFKNSFIFISLALIVISVVVKGWIFFKWQMTVSIWLLGLAIFYPALLIIYRIFMRPLARLINLNMPTVNMNSRRAWTLILLFLTVLVAISFLVFGFNLILGIIFMLLSIIVFFVNNKKWGDRMRESLGIAIFSGLIISLIRDISLAPLSPALQTMYFLGLGASAILLMKSASEGEDL